MKLNKDEEDHLLQSLLTFEIDDGISIGHKVILFNPLPATCETEPILCQICGSAFVCKSNNLTKRDLRHIKPLFTESGIQIAIFKEYECSGSRHQLSASNSLFRYAFEVCGLLRKYLFCKDFVVSRVTSFGIVYDIGHAQSFTSAANRLNTINQMIGRESLTKEKMLLFQRFQGFNLDRRSISEIFLMEFEKQSRLFFSIFGQKLQHLEYFSVDHTYHCVKFIQSRHPVTGKNIRSFKAFFTAMNAQSGELIFAMPTSSEKVMEMEDFLMLIKNNAPNLKLIFTDKCCGDHTFRKVFGNTIQVKLDLGHLVRRISKEIPKKKKNFSLRAQFLRKLRMLVRKSEDKGINRRMQTGSAIEIERNFDELITFAEKLFEGKTYLPKLIEKIKQEKKHSECLADVPVNVKGTNTNEAFHAALKRSMPQRGELDIQSGLCQLYSTIYFLRKEQEDDNLSPLGTNLHNKLMNICFPTGASVALESNDLARKHQSVVNQSLLYKKLSKEMEKYDAETAPLLQMFSFEHLLLQTSAVDKNMVLTTEEFIHKVKSLQLLGDEGPSFVSLHEMLLEILKNSNDGRNIIDSNGFLEQQQEISNSPLEILQNFLEKFSFSVICITNLQQIPVCGYVPSNFSLREPIKMLILFHDDKSVLFSYSKPKEEQDTERLQCSCGSQSKVRESCKKEPKSKCPCIKKNRCCTKNCKCGNKCKNDKETTIEKSIRKRKLVHSKESLENVNKKRTFKESQPENKLISDFNFDDIMSLCLLRRDFSEEEKRILFNYKLERRNKLSKEQLINHFMKMKTKVQDMLKRK